MATSGNSVKRAIIEFGPNKDVKVHFANNDVIGIGGRHLELAQTALERAYRQAKGEAARQLNVKERRERKEREEKEAREAALATARLEAESQLSAEHKEKVESVATLMLKKGVGATEAIQELGIEKEPADPEKIEVAGAGNPSEAGKNQGDISPK